MYTQCESIFCRSIIPLQDTPAIKATYSATVLTPKDIKVRMSANMTSEIVTEQGRITKFENNIPIQSYLIAIAAGNLEYRSLGRRVGVITEPEQMDKTAAELEDLQYLLDMAEEYLTPYEWGTYTILVLPPSFPFGGMENPLLTFASPTIIVGDKSQVYVATHEIAHSWTGNLVTNENWSNFWLNEGFTVKTERHVSKQIHGQDFFEVSALQGNSGLKYDIHNFQKKYGTNTTYATLYPIMDGASPDDSFSEVPYERGFQLLYYLESLIGEDNFQGFMRAYITKFRRESILADQMIDFFNSYTMETLGAQNGKNVLDKVDWNAWVNQTGMPPQPIKFTSPKIQEATEMADAYIALGGKGSPDNWADFKEYFSLLKVVMVQQLLNRVDEVTTPIIQRLDADFNLTYTIDPEIKQLWFQITLFKNYAISYPNIEEFMSVQGRQKYLMPIYQAMIESGKRDMAMNLYKANLGFYHPIAIEALKSLLGIKNTEATEVRKLLKGVIA